MCAASRNFRVRCDSWRHAARRTTVPRCVNDPAQFGEDLLEIGVGARPALGVVSADFRRAGHARAALRCRREREGDPLVKEIVVDASSRAGSAERIGSQVRTFECTGIVVLRASLYRLVRLSIQQPFDTVVCGKLARCPGLVPSHGFRTRNHGARAPISDDLAVSLDGLPSTATGAASGVVAYLAPAASI